MNQYSTYFPRRYAQRPSNACRTGIGCWMLDVGCWMFSTLRSCPPSKPAALLAAAAALALVSCSSAPPPPPPQPAPAAFAPAAPSLLDVGIIMETATGMVTVQAIDAATRTLTLQREDGDVAIFQAGPAVRRFNELKVGDQIMTTATENCTLFLVKGNVAEGVAAQQAVVRTPEGQNLGAIMVNAINVNARVLAVNPDTRFVLLKYSPTRTRDIKIQPDVDISQIGVNDTILVRGTQSIAIMVAKP
jgi:hypothetical protein